MKAIAHISVNVDVEMYERMEEAKAKAGYKNTSEFMRTALKKQIDKILDA